MRRLRVKRRQRSADGHAFGGPQGSSRQTDTSANTPDHVPRAKSREPRAESQEPRAESQEPRARPHLQHLLKNGRAYTSRRLRARQRAPRTSRRRHARHWAPRDTLSHTDDEHRRRRRDVATHATPHDTFIRRTDDANPSRRRRHPSHRRRHPLHKRRPIVRLSVAETGTPPSDETTNRPSMRRQNWHATFDETTNRPPQRRQNWHATFDATTN